MSNRRIVTLAVLGLYTVFAVGSFLYARKYPASALYFIVLVVVWFKIYAYGKKKERELT